MNLTNEGLYQGTLGFVPVDTSRDRAEREADNGTAEDRLCAVERELQRAGMVGATWQQLGQRLNLHHGQISSALTVLHRAGRAAMTTAKHNRCLTRIIMCMWGQALEKQKVYYSLSNTYRLTDSNTLLNTCTL